MRKEYLKKFISGLLFGVLITLPISVYASDQISAYLFPVKVTIYQNGVATDFNTNDHSFLNYNNRTYVPLRAFSEAMGMIVNFEEGSVSNGNNNRIDIYEPSSMIPSAQDQEQYTSLYVTRQSNNKDGTIQIYGLIRVNKDPAGRSIAFANQFVLENALTQPLHSGQLRTFTASMENTTVETYTVMMRGWSAPSPFYKGMIGGPTAELALRFTGKGLGQTISISQDYYEEDNVTILNAAEDTVTLSAMDLHYRIFKVENGKDTLVCSYPIPTFDGGFIELPPGTGSSFMIPSWDFRDQNGALVSPGQYAVQLTMPSNFDYIIDGKAKTLLVKENMWNERYEFTLID